MVSREDENGIFLTVIIIIIYRRGTALPWTSVLVSYLFFFFWEKVLCYASHCPALRIVDYASLRRVHKPRLRTATFNIPEKHCPLERQICEIASDKVFLHLCFNDSYIKSSGVL